MSKLWDGTPGVKKIKNPGFKPSPKPVYKEVYTLSRHGQPSYNSWYKADLETILKNWSADKLWKIEGPFDFYLTNKGNTMNDKFNEITPELAKSLEDVAKQPEVVFTQSKEQVGDESQVAA